MPTTSTPLLPASPETTALLEAADGWLRRESTTPGYAHDMSAITHALRAGADPAVAWPHGPWEGRRVFDTLVEVPGHTATGKSERIPDAIGMAFVEATQNPTHNWLHLLPPLVRQGRWRLAHAIYEHRASDLALEHLDPLLWHLLEGVGHGLPEQVHGQSLWEAWWERRGSLPVWGYEAASCDTAWHVLGRSLARDGWGPTKGDAVEEVRAEQWWCQALLDRVGPAGLNASNARGQTPLTLHVTGHNATHYRALLAAGADPNLPSARGELPLLVAALAHNAKGITALFAAGANPHVCDRDGNTALHWLLRSSHEEYQEYGYTYDESCVRLLIAAGVSEARLNGAGEVALSKGLRLEQTQEAQELLQRIRVWQLHPRLDATLPQPEPPRRNRM